MVRLVFRPYTQFLRSICTSESLRTSIRVSPDFVLTRHSSPSFGSQRVRSWCAPARNEHGTPRACGATANRPPIGPRLARGVPSLSFRLWVSYVPMTRAHARLLGPCFKTGPEGTQSNSVADGRAVYPRAPRPTTRRARRRHEVRLPGHRRRLPRDGRERVAAARHIYTVRDRPGHGEPARHDGHTVFLAGLRPTPNGSRRSTRWRSARGRNGQTDGAVRATRERRTSRDPIRPRTAVPDESPLSNFRVPRVYLWTVSRTLELSLQSSFQLSLTVLVRYRSRGHI